MYIILNVPEKHNGICECTYVQCMSILHVQNVHVHVRTNRTPTPKSFSPQSHSSSAPQPQALSDMALGCSGGPVCLVPMATVAAQTLHMMMHERELLPVVHGDHCIREIKII